MAVVNTNISASISQAALARNERALEKAMEQLSTGRKINTAADNAAGLAISTRMTTQIIGLEQSIQNANDAISMLSTAEGALDEVTNMLQRMRELAIQGANGTTDAADRDYLNKEYQNLISAIDRIATTTEWNGRTILDGTANGASTYATGTSDVSYLIGKEASNTISVTFGNFTQAETTAGLAGGIMEAFNMSSNSAGVQGSAMTIAAANTAEALTVAGKATAAIDTALSAIASQRATFGAATNQMIHTIDNLSNIVTNSEATKSRIMDTDYAKATSELARTQIIQQASTAMLAQANQLPSTVLRLLE